MRNEEGDEYDPSWTLAVVGDLKAFFDACGMKGSAEAAAILLKTVVEEADVCVSTETTNTSKTS
ncbi:MAG: hypothetical protein AAFV54_10465 [Pseudomonadota bacterium]